MISVLLICSPFKIRYGVVFLVTVFMIHGGLIVFIWNKRFGNKPVNNYGMGISGTTLSYAENKIAVSSFLKLTLTPRTIDSSVFVDFIVSSI